MGAYLGEQIVALSGVALGTAAADGSFTPLEQSSDSNGEISLSFNSEGTYLLLAAGTYNGCRVVPAW